ncbi:cohesin complex subunit, partial [Spiromyces aspiralis]
MAEDASARRRSLRVRNTTRTTTNTTQPAIEKRRRRSSAGLLSSERRTDDEGEASAGGHKRRRLARILDENSENNQAARDTEGNEEETVDSNDNDDDDLDGSADEQQFEESSSSAESDTDSGDEYVAGGGSRGKISRRARGGGRAAAGRRGRGGGSRVNAAATHAQTGSPDPNQPVDTDCELFNAIADSQASLKQLALDWINSFRESRVDATCELLNLVVKAAGCPGTLRTEAVENPDAVAGAIAELHAQCKTLQRRGHSRTTMPVDESEAVAKGLNAEYPMLGKSKALKKFPKSMLTFISHAIDAGQHRLVFGEDDDSSEGDTSVFMDTFLMWIFGLAGSSYRPFRHVATLVGLTVISSLISIRSYIEGEAQNAHRQLSSLRGQGASAESLRSRRRSTAVSTESANSIRVKKAEARVQELHGQQLITTNTLATVFGSLFKHRVRDIDPSLRSECLAHLASWIAQDPTSYLESRYLRYLGWGLFDKDSKVRETVVAGIAELYNKGGASVATGLRSFMQRFGARIVQIAVTDCDLKPQVAALHLLATMRAHGSLSSQVVSNWQPLRGSGSSNNGGDDGGEEVQGGIAGGAKKGRHAAKQAKLTARSGKRGGASWSLSQSMMLDSDNDSDAEDGTLHNGESSINSVDLFSFDNAVLRFPSPSGVGEFTPPTHPILEYVSPLLFHTNAQVRAAASPLVSWWVKTEWAAKIARIGIDDEDEDSEDEAAARDSSLDPEALTVEDETDDLAGVNFDEISRNIAQRHADSPSQQAQDLRRWSQFKALAAFLRILVVAGHSRDPRTQPASAIATDLAGTQGNESAHRLVDSEAQWDAISQLLAAAPLARAEQFSALWSVAFAADHGDSSTDFSRLALAAAAVWRDLAMPNTIKHLADYLSLDHSRSTLGSSPRLRASQRSDPLPSDRHCLTRDEEIILLHCYTVWVAERDASLQLKLSREKRRESRRKLETRIELPSRLAVIRLEGLLRRHASDPAALLPLLGMMASHIRWQVFFDMRQLPVLQRISEIVVGLLPRHAQSIPTIFMCVRVLSLIDDLGLLKYGNAELNFDSNVNQLLDIGVHQGLSDLVVPALVRGGGGKEREDGDSEDGVGDEYSDIGDEGDEVTAGEEGTRTDEEDTMDVGNGQEAPKRGSRSVKKHRQALPSAEDPTVPGPLVRIATAQAIIMFARALHSVALGAMLESDIHDDPVEFIRLSPSEQIHEFQAIRMQPEQRIGVCNALNIIRAVIAEKDITAHLFSPLALTGDREDGKQGDGGDDVLHKPAGLNYSRGIMQWLDMLVSRSGTMFDDPDILLTSSALEVNFRFVVWSAYRLNEKLRVYTDIVVCEADANDADAESVARLDAQWKEISQDISRLVADRDRLHDSCVFILDNTAQDAAGAGGDGLSASGLVQDRVLSTLSLLYQLFTGDLVRRPPQLAQTSDSDAKHGSNYRVESIFRARKQLLLHCPRSIHSQLSSRLQRLQCYWSERLEAAGQAVRARSPSENVQLSDVVSALELYYQHVLGVTASWAQLINAAVIPSSSLALIGQYVGTAGLETSLKEWERHVQSRRQISTSRRAPPKGGFVSLSGFDHIVQTVVEGLKARLTLQATRASTLDAYRASLEGCLEVSVGIEQIHQESEEGELRLSARECSPLREQSEPPRNPVTLARMIAGAIRTAFPQRDARG